MSGFSISTMRADSDRSGPDPGPAAQSHARSSRSSCGGAAPGHRPDLSPPPPPLAVAAAMAAAGSLRESLTRQGFKFCGRGGPARHWHLAAAAP